MTTGGLTLILKRVFAATPDRLFEAWTNPAQLTAWWGPAEVTAEGVEIDLSIGGHYQIGNRLPDGRVTWIKGRFIDIERPSRLVYSWTLGDDHETRVTVTFDAAPEGTLLTIVHELLTSDESRTGHERGWQGCLDGLSEYLGEA